MGQPLRKDELGERSGFWEETYYEILKVNPSATISEIVAAYHTARHTFSKESIATYSLFGPDEIQAIMNKLDEAYQTLSNIEKKQQYDRLLELKIQTGDLSVLTELELKQRTTTADKRAKSSLTEAGGEYTPLPSDYQGHISGRVLKEIREKRKITAEEVAKTTKIPLRYIQALENDDLKSLPARVYLQGFVKNIASFFRLEPQLVMKSYLEYIDNIREK